VIITFRMSNRRCRFAPFARRFFRPSLEPSTEHVPAVRITATLAFADSWTGSCHMPVMIARRFEDLDAWRLAHTLEQEVFAFTRKLPVSRDVRFCDQIRESARSAARNTAEGFGRYYPMEFRRFLRIAAGSLHETKNHLTEALERGYLTSVEHLRLKRLTLRALKATVRLADYLRTAQAPTPFGKHRKPSEP
jgi:four helix bundle protein